jgi:hypothetical protein
MLKKKYLTITIKKECGMGYRKRRKIRQRDLFN